MIKCYVETNKVVKFPIGDWRKTLSSAYQKQAKEYGIGRFDGFDAVIACRNEITCNSCSHNWTQINQGNPESSTFKCGSCGSKNLNEIRMNYNYRTDNCEKHWGSSQKEHVLSQMHISKINSLSKKDKEEYMKMHGISEPQPINNKGLESEITKKANALDNLSYKELKRLCIEKGYDKNSSMKKDKLIAFLSQS